MPLGDRGRVVPDVYAARALGRLVESARITPPGRGTAWLLGEEEPTPDEEDVGALISGAQFHTTSRELRDALAAGRVPAAYRRPLARLLARLLAELEDPPLPPREAAPETTDLTKD